MCVVSMIMDHQIDEWTKKWIQPNIYPTPNTIPCPIDWQPPIVPFPLTQPEIDLFRQQMAEFQRLLERARKYDREHNEPDCELESKKEILRKIAEAIGVPITFEDEYNG